MSVPDYKGTPTNKAVAAEHAKDVAVTTHFVRRSTCKIPHWTYHHQSSNDEPLLENRRHYAQDTSSIKAQVYLLDPTADATCPLCMKEEQAVEDYEDTPTLHYLQQRTFGCPSTPLSYLAQLCI